MAEWQQVTDICCHEWLVFRECTCILIQKVATLRQTMQQKFSEQHSDGVRLGFKLPDGTRVDYTFPSESTVKVTFYMLDLLNALVID